MGDCRLQLSGQAECACLTWQGCGASTPSKYAAPTGDPSPSRAVQRQSSNLSNRPSVGSHAGFAAFISHAKAEASMEARFLQTELEGSSAWSHRVPSWCHSLGAGRLGPGLLHAFKRRASAAQVTAAADGAAMSHSLMSPPLTMQASSRSLS